MALTSVTRSFVVLLTLFACLLGAVGVANFFLISWTLSFLPKRNEVNFHMCVVFCIPAKAPVNRIFKA